MLTRMADLPWNVEVPNQVLKNLMSLASMEEHSMLNLAGLTLVQEFLKSDKKGEVKLTFLQNGILEPLLMAFDKGMASHKDLVYLRVSLSCIFFLSGLPVSPVQPLICEQVIKRMLQVIDQKSSFYQYPPIVKLNLQKMCENKHLVGNIQETCINVEQWNNINRKSKNRLKSTPHRPSVLFLCDIVDSGVCETGLNIREHLLSRNLTWANRSVVKAPTKDNEEDWKDLLITHVVEGPVFWAQVGIETIQNAQKIQAILNVYWKNGALEHCGCEKGDNRVALQFIDDEVCPVRMTVKEVNTRGVCGWAMDGGQVIQTDQKHVFALPNEVRLEAYPPQASLCCLDGVQAPPGCGSAVETSLAVLCNLTKRSFPAGQLFQQMGGLDVCLSFLKTCPSVDLKLQACQLMCNLSCNPAILTKCSDNQLIPVMIGLLQESFDMKSPALKNELILAILRTLSNLMYYNDVNRSIFYQFEGVEIVTKCCMLYGRSHAVYKAATKCIKMFICKALERNGKSDTSLPTKKSSPVKTRGSQVMQDTPLIMRRILRQNSETDKFIWKPKAVEKVVDESRFQEAESSDDELADHQFSLLDLKPRELEEASSKRQAMAVDVAEVYRSSQQREVFVYDSMVSIQNNSTNELRPNKSVTTISANTVVQHVCGMLNSGKGGNIYFGLSPLGKVVGIKLNRDERDEFRLGVDRMMLDRLSPCLLHSSFDVVYTPVVQKRTVEEDIIRDPEEIPDCFVTKIVLTPTRGALHTVTPGEECYYRFGSRTTSLSIQELRHLIILEEEEEFRDRIKVLNTELKAFQQQLGVDS